MGRENKFAPENPEKDQAAIEALLKATQTEDEKEAQKILNLMEVKEVEGLSAKELKRRQEEKTSRKKSLKISSWDEVMARAREVVDEDNARREISPETEFGFNEDLEDLMKEAEKINPEVADVYRELINLGYDNVQSVIDAIHKRDRKLETKLMVKIVIAGNDNLSVNPAILREILKSRDKAKKRRDLKRKGGNG